MIKHKRQQLYIIPWPILLRYVFRFQLFLVLTVQSFVKTFPLTLKILKFKIKLCALSGFTQY